MTASTPALASPPLPQGGQFVDGQGCISRNGANLDINQTSARGIIDWRSFSIGNGRTVTIDNGSGATLNRVTGNAMSLLNGNLTATGSVYLINPNGVLVGPTGVIATGGRFVASTLDADNNAFMQGGPLTLSGNSMGAVLNLGRISSSGGDVFLVSDKAVANLGSIDAPNGTAELATGNQVLLQDSSSGQQVFVQAGNGGQTLNAGTIRAAQISLQATDGNVYALAGHHSVLRATGTAMRNGHVWLVADSGTVDAHGAHVAAQNADGSGGTVDMSGNTLEVGDAKIDAAQWNLTAPTFTIDAPTARTFSRNLSQGTSIAVNAGGGTGDIGVQSDIRWNGASSLTLNANHSVTIAPNTTIANTGSGNLVLRADAGALDNGGSAINGGTIDWSQSTGIVSALYDMSGSYSAGTLLSNTSWTAPLYSGLITQITGYQLVNSASDLQNIASDLNGNYALGKDIDVGGFAFETLGSTTPFTGQFYGMWHTISNISPASTAMFGAIGATGVVRDLNVNANTGVGFGHGASGTGILANSNDGTVTNVFASGSITDWQGQQGGSSLAGLVGTNRGLIARSGSSASVSASEAAGLVLDNQGTIAESYVTGSVYGMFLTGVAGGLMISNEGTITQSYVAGSVRSAGTMPGVPGQAGAICLKCTGISSDVYWSVGAAGTSWSGSNLPASNGLSAAQMSDPASFVGWDFSPGGAWVMPAGAAQPVLAWQVSGR